MATGTTLTINVRGDQSYHKSVAMTDAGSPTAGTVQVIYDDDETQLAILKALQDAVEWVATNVQTR